MTRLRRLVLIAALGVGAMGATPAVLAPAHAIVGCPTLNGVALTITSTVSPAGGTPFVICSGKVPSFDGTPLDTDVSVPTTMTSAKPLMLMFHGWGQDKTAWESTTLNGDGGGLYHWNNAWFVSQGWVVLNYTARGFHTSCGKDTSGYIYTTDPACSGKASWTHLADRRWEIHDAQFLAGLLVDAGLANPNQIAATGDSYGGGQSWDLALSQDQVVASSSTDPTTPTTTAWTSPLGTPLHLVAAIPHYGWTDLEDALLPNGRSSDGFNGAPADGSHQNPYGVDKQSYVAGLYADGQASAQYATPGTDPTADLTQWFAGVTAGEPYSANPTAVEAATQIGGIYRSAYAMPVPAPGHQVPIFTIQGFTDPLFDMLQSQTEINKLQHAYAGYPVWAFYGDIGHSYADNPAQVWQQAHNEANTWLAEILSGGTVTVPGVTADTTTCVSGQTLQSYTGPGFGAISGAPVSGTYSGLTTVIAHAAPVSPPTASYEGLQTDPIVNSGCRSMQASQSDPSPSQASFTFDFNSITVLGGPVVTLDGTLTGSNAELAARLWDVNPATGTQTLMSRTVYRFDEGTSPTTPLTNLAFELWPNAWQILPGHQVKLELTMDDFPVWRPDNEPASITLSSVTLTLPTATSTPATVVPEAPAAALFALLAMPLFGATAFLRRRRRSRVRES